jgi:hypothetical protein
LWLIGFLGWRLWSSGRDRERNPRCVAFRSILASEVLVGFQIEIALMRFAKREEEPDLWTDAGYPPLEIAKRCAGAAVAGELLKK